MFAELHKSLNYYFHNEKLLEEALTHPSICKQKDNQKLPFNYERLEFLGDAVLGLVIAEMLIEIYPDDSEGSLAKRHSALVCGKSITQIARDINLGKNIIMSQNELLSGGQDNESILENVMEALIGAIYLDSGFDSAKEFISKLWSPLARELQSPPKDAKTTLQEWSQGRGLAIPEYIVMDQTGPAHAPVFTIKVQVEGYESATGKGASKKEAEMQAASKLISMMGIEKSNEKK